MGRTKRWVGQIAFFVVSGAAVYAAFYFTFKSKPKTGEHAETATEHAQNSDSSDSKEGSTHENANSHGGADRGTAGHTDSSHARGETSSSLEHKDDHKAKLAANFTADPSAVHGGQQHMVKSSGPMPTGELKKFTWGWAFGSSFEKESGTNVCRSFEYLSGGPASVQAMDKKWPALKKQFHKAKADLQTFLSAQGSKLKSEEIAAFKNKVAELRILRPVVTEEFDLLYRGIGTWVKDNHGRELLRVSPGLVKMVELNPARSQFEITRLVAQTLSPCALEKLGAIQAWSEFLGCMDLKDISADCKEGGYSEAGWAISTALAQATTDPLCVVPAFKTESGAKCLSDLMGDFKVDRKVAEQKSTVKTAMVKKSVKKAAVHSEGAHNSAEHHAEKNSEHHAEVKKSESEVHHE